MTQQELEQAQKHWEKLNEINPSKAQAFMDSVGDGTNVSGQDLQRLMYQYPTEIKVAEQPKPEPIELSLTRGEPGYWGDLDVMQLVGAGNAAGFSVTNPDGTINQNNYAKFTRSLADKELEQTRYNIAHGGKWGDVFDGDKWNGPLDNPLMHNIGGSLMRIFTPRVQESISMGKDPTWKDYAGDMGENALQMIPFTGASTMAGKIGLGILGAVSAPLLGEVYDANVYDADENPDRSYFNPNDVVQGAAVNAVTPFAMYGGGKFLGKVAGDRKFAGSFAKSLENFGANPASNAEEFLARQRQLVADAERKSSFPISQANLEGRSVASPEEVAKAKEIIALGEKINSGDVAVKPYKPISLPKELGIDPALFNKKAEIAHNLRTSTQLSPRELQLINENPELLKLGAGTYERWKSPVMMAYAANKYGDTGLADAQANAFVGQMPESVQKAIDRKPAMDKTKKERVQLAEEKKALKAKNEREARWARGEATFQEKQTPEYKDWWFRHNKMLVGLE